MQNQKFINLAESQKRRKFKFFLKEKTQGFLRETELNKVVEKITIK